MTVVIVCTFIICGLPYFLLEMMYNFGLHVSKRKIYGLKGLLDWVENQPTRCSFMLWSEAVVQLQTQVQHVG